jgi:hypothetical protein
MPRWCGAPHVCHVHASVDGPASEQFAVDTSKGNMWSCRHGRNVAGSEYETGNGIQVRK